MNYFTILPQEILLEILKKLSTKDLGRIAQVSKALKNASEDTRLWSERYYNTFFFARYYTPEDRKELMKVQKSKDDYKLSINSQLINGIH